MATQTKRKPRSKTGPGRPKGSTSDTPNHGSKAEQIVQIIRSDNPPADLKGVAARAKKRKAFDGVAPSRSLLYKVRRYLTAKELKTYFPGGE